MKILIVDDNKSIRSIIKARFNELGYDTLDVSTGEEALIKLSEEDFLLVTLDVELPGISGYEVCLKLREIERKNQKNTPVLFVTGTDTLEGRIKGFESGGTEFITKPFSKQEFEKVIENIFHPYNPIKNTTILIADDVSISRKIISGIIHEKGGITLEAENGLQALDIIKEKAGKIDMIITDLFMPEMNGDEFCFRVRNQFGLKSIPIIFLTASSDQKNILNVFSSGGSDYIMKPFIKEEFVSRLYAHCNSFNLSKALEHKIEELKKINKLKDNFLSICSHDLRNPLNGIIGFSDLLLSENSLSDDDKESLKYIKNSGEYLLTLINNLLDIASIEYEKPIELTEIDLEPLLSETVSFGQIQAQGKNISLSYNTDGVEIKNILGDKIAIKRIFNNLLSNALKFTPVSGKIQLNTKTIHDSFEITITDSGIGISPENIGEIFNKFSKASKPGTKGEVGTGLGLSITEGLITKMSGTIQVKSELGKGTSFTVNFPKI